MGRRIYIDDGKTGTDSDRAFLKQMVSEIKQGEVSCLVIKDDVLKEIQSFHYTDGEYIFEIKKAKVNNFDESDVISDVKDSEENHPSINESVEESKIEIFQENTNKSNDLSNEFDFDFSDIIKKKINETKKHNQKNFDRH